MTTIQEFSIPINKYTKHQNSIEQQKNEIIYGSDDEFEEEEFWDEWIQFTVEDHSISIEVMLPHNYLSDKQFFLCLNLFHDENPNHFVKRIQIKKENEFIKFTDIKDGFYKLLVVDNNSTIHSDSNRLSIGNIIPIKCFMNYKDCFQISFPEGSNLRGGCFEIIKTEGTEETCIYSEVIGDSNQFSIPLNELKFENVYYMYDTLNSYVTEVKVKYEVRFYRKDSEISLGSLTSSKKRTKGKICSGIQEHIDVNNCKTVLDVTIDKNMMVTVFYCSLVKQMKIEVYQNDHLLDSAEVTQRNGSVLFNLKDKNLFDGYIEFHCYSLDTGHIIKMASFHPFRELSQRSR